MKHLKGAVCAAAIALDMAVGTTFEHSVELRNPGVGVPVSASSSFVRDGEVIQTSEYQIVSHVVFEQTVLWPLKDKPRVVSLDITESLTSEIKESGADAIVNFRIVPLRADNLAEMIVGIGRIPGTVFLVFGGVFGILAIDDEYLGPMALGFGGAGLAALGASFLLESSSATTYVFRIEGDAVKLR